MLFNGRVADHSNVAGRLNDLPVTPNDFLSLNHAMEAAMSTHGLLYLPAGEYPLFPLKSTNKATIIQGSGIGRTILKYRGRQSLFTGDNAQHWHFSNLTIEVNGGLALAGNWNDCTFDKVEFTQQHPGVPILAHDSSMGGHFISNVFRDCWWNGQPGHSVPLIDLIGKSTVNSNRFTGGRYTHSGNYVFHIKSNNSQGYENQNVIEGAVFEVTTGGNVWIEGCNKTVVRDCMTYDPHAGGPITRDLYRIEGTPLKSQDTTLENLERGGGQLGRGVHDIHLARCAGTIVQMCNASGGYSLHVGPEGGGGLVVSP